jgi:hypothetical protein
MGTFSTASSTNVLRQLRGNGLFLPWTRTALPNVSPMVRLNTLSRQTLYNPPIAGIPVIIPSKLWSLDDLIHAAISGTPVQILPHHEAVLVHMTDSAVSGAQPSFSVKGASINEANISQTSDRGTVDWANAPDDTPRRATHQTRLNSSNIKRGYQAQVRSSSSMPGMEVDDDNLVPQAPAPPPTRDPRDDLQEQLEAVLISVLPSLVEQSIAAHNQPTNVSIHAYSYSTPLRGSSRATKRSLPPPSSTEWKAWPPHECVLFLADYPPSSSLADPAPWPKKSPTSSPPLPFPEKTRSALQYLASIIQKNRKGREFGRGDWERASAGLAALWPPFKDVIVQAVKDVFES